MQRLSQAKHYAANRAYYRERHKAYTVRNRNLVDAYKAEKGCEHCGEREPVCLDLHHVDPKTKRRCVSIAVGNSWSVENLMAEVERCRVVCANCHRKEHFLPIRKKRAVAPARVERAVSGA